MEKQLVSYVYAENADGQRFPFACVVGDKSGRIGLSVCRKGDKFNKRTARMLAAQNRTRGFSFIIPKRKINGMDIAEMIDKAIERMEVRINRYFNHLPKMSPHLKLNKPIRNVKQSDIDGKLVIFKGNVSGRIYCARVTVTSSLAVRLAGQCENKENDHLMDVPWAWSALENNILYIHDETPLTPHADLIGKWVLVNYEGDDGLGYVGVVESVEDDKYTSYPIRLNPTFRLLDNSCAGGMHTVWRKSEIQEVYGNG